MSENAAGGPMQRRLSAAAAFALLLAVDGAPAQELMPWRQGVVAPKGDAGFWWMTAEGGFARQQGLDLRMRAFDSDIAMVDALRGGELDAFEGSPTTPMI